MLIPLQTLIDQMGEGSEMLQQTLSSFYCSQDVDIENFFKNRSVEFERLGKSRTYILCDEDKLISGEIVITGYFSLSLKVLILPEELSVRARKEYDGYRGKIHGNLIREIPCYLIGQLARNSNIDKSLISGSELIDHACSVIQSAVDAVGGRYVLVECHPSDNLLKFYSNNGFFEFARIPLDDMPMVQMIRKI